MLINVHQLYLYQNTMVTVARCHRLVANIHTSIQATAFLILKVSTKSSTYNANKRGQRTHLANTAQNSEAAKIEFVIHPQLNVHLDF